MHDADRFEALTGIRGFAAVWVLSFHYALGPFTPIGGAHVVKLVQVGYLGVDLFFILSGFVIWHAHGDEMGRPSLRKFARFMCLRWARLYPVYLFTLALLALLIWLRPQWGDPSIDPANYTERQLLLQMALVQSWGFTHQLTWNYPSWSVSAEWFCYLFFPAIALVGTRIGARGTLVALLLLCAVVAATYETAFDSSLNQSKGALTLLRAAPEFAIGCLLSRLVQQLDMRSWPWAAIVAGFAGLWAVSFWTVLPIGLFAIPLFIVLVLACAMRPNRLSRFFSLRPIVALGAASYSLYLMQAPVQKAAKVFRPALASSHPWRDAAIVAFYLALVAAGTTLVHLFVENPSRRMLRRRIDALFAARPRLVPPPRLQP